MEEKDVFTNCGIVNLDTVNLMYNEEHCYWDRLDVTGGLKSDCECDLEVPFPNTPSLLKEVRQPSNTHTVNTRADGFRGVGWWWQGDIGKTLKFLIWESG